MQVTEVHDHVNHAIIGGKDTIAFGISNSAEFFDILSTSLYSDQKLAVVRETMCNAWDIHIETGRTDIPIEVTLTEKELVIKDFGTGIHHEDIGPVYGIYGNSTKKNDGTQTGGFGLGCKSPFSYVQHFEVTSCHDKVKTVYRLSKAAVQSNGKPAIVPLMSMPTEESGLTVKIDVKSYNDYAVFQELIPVIASNGEMLVKFNGNTQLKLGFDPTINNYFVYRNRTLIVGMNPKITVRYGNVIYPIGYSEKISDLSNQIEEFLNELSTSNSSYGGNYKIVFQAPPHSLSVTPSRESLSMQEHTINTLKKIFTDFLAEKKKVFQSACDMYAETAIQTAVGKKSYTRLLSRDSTLPIQLWNYARPEKFTDFESMAKHFMHVQYPNDLDFRKVDWKCRVMLMLDQKLLTDRGLVYTWLKEVDSVKELERGNTRWNRSNYKYPWLGKRVIAPLVSKLAADPNMRTEALYVVDPYDTNVKGRGGMVDIVPATKVNPSHHFYTAAYLRKIVVLARRKIDVWERAKRHDIFEKQFGTVQGFLFYHVGLKVVDADNARAFFAKTGMTVVDLIDRQEWEEEYVEPASIKAAKADRAPRNKGLAQAKVLLDNGDYISYAKAFKKTEERISKPEYIIRAYNVDVKHYKRHLDFLDDRMSVQFLKLFGDRGAVCTNTLQYQNYMAKGAIYTEEFLQNEVVKYFNANKAEIVEYWSHKPARVNLPTYTSKIQSVLDMVYNTPELAAQYKVNATLSDTSKLYLAFYDHLIARKRYEKNQIFVDLKAEMDQIKLNPHNAALIKKIEKSKLINLLEIRDVADNFKSFKGNKNLLNKAFLIVTTALES